MRNNLLKPFAGDSPGVSFLHLKGSVVTPIHMFSHVKVSSVSVGSSPEVSMSPSPFTSVLWFERSFQLLRSQQPSGYRARV